MKKIIALSFFLFSLLASCHKNPDQPKEALATIERFFAPQPWPQKDQYWAASLSPLKETFGQQLANPRLGMNFSYREIYNKKGRAVVAVELNAATIPDNNMYFTLKKENFRWVVEQVINFPYLQSRNEEDEKFFFYIHAVAQRKPEALRRLESDRQDAGFLMTTDQLAESYRLFLAGDSKLKDFFDDRKEVLNAIIDAVHQEKLNMVVTLVSEPFQDIAKMMAENSILMVKRINGGFALTVNSIGETEVSFVKAENPKELPTALESGTILFEPLGNGWYLYKSFLNMGYDDDAVHAAFPEDLEETGEIKTTE